MRKTDTLLVVAKKPAPGQTKTRLCPPLTPAQAADLYECFLRDTLDAMRKVSGVECVIAYQPEDAKDYFQLLAPDMSLTHQRGMTLGERLDDLLTEALVGGSQKAVVMDSDSPTLPVEFLSKAFEKLRETDIVLGPTTDGGYYLIGLKKPQPRLLRQVQMSTSHVLSDTLALAETSGLTVSLLPTWYDVDTITDLYRLENELTEMRTDGHVAATSRWLAQSGWRVKRE